MKRYLTFTCDHSDLEIRMNEQAKFGWELKNFRIIDAGITVMPPIFTVLVIMERSD